MQDNTTPTSAGAPAPAGAEIPKPEVPISTPPTVPVATPGSSAPDPSPSPVVPPAAPVVPPAAPLVPPPPAAPPEQPYSAEVQADIANNRMFALLAYLSLLCLVVLALKSRSRFVAFHARQGLLIMVIQLLSLYTITWGGSGLLLVGITFGFSVIGILEILRGNYWQFPYLGQLSQKLTFF